LKYFFGTLPNVTQRSKEAKKQRSKEAKKQRIKKMDTCTGCKSVKYIVGSKEHYENLHFDQQTKSWWCYKCCGYAEIIDGGGDTPVINLITREVVKKNKKE